ncbi:MAG: SAM-dependent DNA methyltransferase [Acidimicrobiaceae bacterium]|nr:SAM-dependent DNA methyltransferase [Acidimicrobiaceae bacterium]MYE96841.1 SAM-dependent DNA methyltransferase [Acidimicrobiaceae bacterium]MYI54904.1 SAM-dependent DNA methyltransferase [Acidimicrobiaceae bacterium]
MATDLGRLQSKLWEAADQLRANSGLKASEYASPVLGLIFLRYADERFAEAAETVCPGSARRPTGPEDYQAAGALYLPEQSRFETLLDLPEGADLGRALNRAMDGIEGSNPDLRGVLPRDYSRIPDHILAELLRLLRTLPEAIEGDGFGLIYEYFLGNFAFSEGQKGGEFFTPTSIVRLIVEILEPFHGKIYDPACGSGGMFVQSAHFVERHRHDPGEELSVYGQEKTGDTVKLAKMNLAVHGLGGDIREGNTYYEDLHDAVGKFDFVMANPPFNVDKIDKTKLEDDPRFPFGLPRPDNGNYIWIQTFYSALNADGRAGFVMANSASDARGSELEIRRKLIEDRSVDVIIAVGTNMFYTVTLPVTLWFLDRSKRHTDRADQVLFIDAREIYNQIDRAHRDWTPRQIEFLANVVRLWRDEKPEFDAGSEEMLSAVLPDGTYDDVAGLCFTATVDQIEEQGWSLNAGRYVGFDASHSVDASSWKRLEELTGEFQALAEQSRELTRQVSRSLAAVLGDS